VERCLPPTRADATSWADRRRRSPRAAIVAAIGPADASAVAPAATPANRSAAALPRIEPRRRGCDAACSIRCCRVHPARRRCSPVVFRAAGASAGRSPSKPLHSTLGWAGGAAAVTMKAAMPQEHRTMTPIEIPAELHRSLAARIEGPEVRAVKAMLNVVVGSKLDTESPQFDDKTAAAVKVFQRQQHLGADGMVGRARTYPSLLRLYRLHYRLLTDAAAPLWLRAAYGERGNAEVAGAASNPRIVEYLNTCPALTKAHQKTKEVPVLDRKTGKPRIGKDGKPRQRIVWDTSSPLLASIDETAWCAAFVNWCLKKSGLPGLDSDTAGLAATWLGYGQPLDGTPRYGAITVIYNAAAANSSLTASGYHVGFLVDGGIGNSVTLLGGNQGNQVKLSTFTGWELKGMRWPQADD
jgi:uncharacterized protein (TIGR02594 family)